MLETILSWLTIKTVLIGLITGLIIKRLIRKWKYRLPPGPWALPIVGNILQFKTNFLHEEIFEWSKKYGPVMTVHIGPAPIIVVNDIASAMEVLVKKGADFATRTSVPSLDRVTEGGKDIILGKYGPTWRLHRKIASKALRHYMQGDALEERVHKAINIVFVEMKKETEPFDPVDYVNFIVGNILNALCFGETYKFNDPEFLKIIELDDDLLEVFSKGGPPEDFIPCLRYVWESKGMRALGEGADWMLESVIKKKYKEHEKTFNKGASHIIRAMDRSTDVKCEGSERLYISVLPTYFVNIFVDKMRDFTDNLILARHEAEADPEEQDLDKLTDTHIMQTLSDIFFAGIDTSRLSLRFAILHMAAYPDIQLKVQQEIDRVVGKDELPKLKDRPKLGYTEAVLHESMRLSSVIPTGIPHTTTCDTSVAGYDAPKDTVVMINHWALHHDPKAWNNVNEFRPERFLDSNGKLGPKPESWLPFSAGRRVCLGESVAKPELHLIFAALMQNFTWQLPDGVTADLSPDGNSFALVPKLHKLIIKKR